MSHLLQAFDYRRVQSSHPIRKWNGPCSVAVNERLLLPNLGREGAVFMVSVYELIETWRFCFCCHSSRQVLIDADLQPPHAGLGCGALGQDATL